MHIIIIALIIDSPSVYAYYSIKFADVPVCIPIKPTNLPLTLWNAVCRGVL
jgi:hypothetical protein